jgi:hypothetical protein
MLWSAWDSGADVFLTRDMRVLDVAGGAAQPFPAALTPSQLATRLSALGQNLLFLGQVQHPDCRWASGLPFGDMGKWSALLEALSV